MKATVNVTLAELVNRFNAELLDEYCATIVCEPRVKAEVWNDAAPPDRVAVPRTLDPS